MNNTLLIVLVLCILLFGGFGYSGSYGPRYWGGGGILLLLLVLVLLFGGLRL